MAMTVQVKCKSCGNMAPVNHFKLDYHYGFVVCPLCQRGKDTKIKPKRSPIMMRKEELPRTGPRKAKPAGWDFEDELLEKLWQEKQKLQGRLVPVASGLMRYTCGKCKYSFTFKRDKQPERCPYCDTAIKRP